MSEQELNSILNEIKNKGKNSDEVNSQEANVQNENAELTLNENEANNSNDAEAGIAFDQFDNQNREPMPENSPEPPKKQSKKASSKTIICIIVAIIVAIAVVVAGVMIAKNKNDTQKASEPSVVEDNSNTEPSVADVGAINPFTGESGYNESAINKRPVAVVVENEYSTESVRPQWGLSDADMVLEGESEYSTRLLLFWADNSSLPERVGPARSARPPFIRFSQLFDCVFIHAGLSHSKGNYVGASEVFGQLNVAHFNLLSCSSDYFRRDKSRTSTIEHTGYLVGPSVPKLLEQKDMIRKETNADKMTKLEFNETATDLSDTKAETVKFRWTSSSEGGRCPKTGTFTYDANAKAYTTTDFDSSYGKANVAWTNLIFLLDKTEYIVKDNYKNSGSSETYCDYALEGGKGMVLSNGTALDITWGVDNGKLWLKDTNGNDVKLNVGKSYIGYGSSNHGGSITINPTEE